MTAPETQRLLLDDCDAKVLLCSDDCRESLAGVEVALAKLVPGGRIAFDFDAPELAALRSVARGAARR